MKITILGSGTSHGVPVIGCSCDVCKSTDPNDTRTRSSILVEENDARILVDTSTDFRFQALRENISHLHAVLITHAHADHISGLDDTRSLTWEEPLPIYASQDTADEIRTRFAYIFEGSHIGGAKPRIDLKILGDGPTTIAQVNIRPIPIKHGDLDIFGFRFSSFAYLTDCSFISEESYSLLDGVEFLILGALRYRPHATHFSIDEAVAASSRIGARSTWLTHMCHEVDHARLAAELPNGVRPAFDGMILRP